MPKGKVEQNENENQNNNSPRELYVNTPDNVFDNDPDSFNQGYLAEEDEETGEKLGSAWDDKKDAKDFVTKLPDENSFLFQWSRNYNEPIRRAPVFESSAFFHGSAMHSHMALRFTRPNSKSGRLERRRVGIGFASQSGFMVGAGKIQNEYFNTSDGSTETPITMKGFENVVGAIERTQGNIDAMLKRNSFLNLFRSGKRPNTEFSGKYNLFTNNCNDFVIAMAKAAGVDNVAKLHTSLWGPMAAYKNIRMAAEKGEGRTGTRVFLSGFLGLGSNTYQKANTLINDFMSRANFGLSKDGISPASEPGFVALLNAVHAEAPGIATYEQRAREEIMKPEADADFSFVTKEARDKIDHLIGTIRKAVEYGTVKPHPKTSRYLLQLESIARSIISISENPNNSAEDYDVIEKNNAVTALTNEEESASETGKVDVTKVFGSQELGFGSMRVMGELLLHETGSGDLVVPFEGNSRTERLPEKEKTDRLNKALSNIKGNTSKEAKDLISKFIGARTFLSSRQIGQLLAVDLLSGMGLKFLSNIMASRFQVQDEDAAKMIETINRRKAVYIKERGLSEDDKIERETQYDIGVQISDAFISIVEAIRAQEKAG